MLLLGIPAQKWLLQRILSCKSEAKMGDYHLFRLLVAAGADINQKTSKAGRVAERFPKIFAFDAFSSF